MRLTEIPPCSGWVKNPAGWPALIQPGSARIFRKILLQNALIFALLLFLPRGKGQGCDISSSTWDVTAQSSSLGTNELNANFNRIFFWLGKAELTEDRWSSALPGESTAVPAAFPGSPSIEFYPFQDVMYSRSCESFFPTAGTPEQQRTPQERFPLPPPESFESRKANGVNLNEEKENYPPSQPRPRLALASHPS